MDAASRRAWNFALHGGGGTVCDVRPVPAPVAEQAAAEDGLAVAMVEVHVMMITVRVEAEFAEVNLAVVQRELRTHGQFSLRRLCDADQESAQASHRPNHCAIRGRNSAGSERRGNEREGYGNGITRGP
jgi:hypothetical protein